jgi:hypothetical protein
LFTYKLEKITFYWCEEYLGVTKESKKPVSGVAAVNYTFPLPLNNHPFHSRVGLTLQLSAWHDFGHKVALTCKQRKRPWH